MQQQLRDKETLQRQKNRERKIRARLSGLNPLPCDLEDWLRRKVLPAYFFYDYRKGAKSVRGLCSACGQTVELIGVRHNAKGMCPHCGRELTMKSNGKRGYIWDRVTASVVQRFHGGNLIVRVVKAYQNFRKNSPTELDWYEETRIIVKAQKNSEASTEVYHHSGDSVGITHWKKGYPPVMYLYQQNFNAETCGYLYCKNLGMPFNVLEGFDGLENKSDKLNQLTDLGFTPCHYLVSNRKLNAEETEDGIQRLRQFAKDYDIPIDGVVMTYNNIAYAKSCGRTGHHYKDGIAFKFEDDLYETRMTCIEWTPSRTGEIAPVAILKPVEIDGCTVSRASLHNVSFIEGLELMPGNRVLISKRNQIIPHVEENLDRGGFCMEKAVIQSCSCCHQPTRIHENKTVVNGVERIVKTLFCDNPNCATRRLRQFVHFAGEKAMDIEGLSETTLEKLIGWGVLDQCLDIYHLDEHRDEILMLDGFGEKSWQNLWDAIQRSRDTTFERYLIAMDIPLIGNTASRTLARQFHSSLDEFEVAVCGGFDFTQLPDFGSTLNQNIYDWFGREENWYLWCELRSYVRIAPAAPEQAEPVRDNPFVGLTIVVTGKVEPYTRGEINAKIEALGAHAGSSVSSKTNYLVCGENAGSKLDKARSLGITVLTPAQFFQMAGV